MRRLKIIMYTYTYMQNWLNLSFTPLSDIARIGSLNHSATFSCDVFSDPCASSTVLRSHVIGGDNARCVTSAATKRSQDWIVFRVFPVSRVVIGSYIIVFLGRCTGALEFSSVDIGIDPARQVDPRTERGPVASHCDHNHHTVIYVRTYCSRVFVYVCRMRQRHNITLLAIII